MITTKTERVLFFVLFLGILTIYVLGLFFNITGDAAKYAYISKEIIQSGDWFSLHIQGQAYLQKPPLLFWLSAISFNALGVSNFSFKLPIFLYTLLGLWGTYRLGKTLFNRNIGRLAAVMMLFSAITVIYSSDIHTDIVLQTNVVLSLWFIYEYLNNKKLGYLIGAALATGLSVLTKGPFGAILPFIAVLGFHISQKRIAQLFSIKWLFFIVIVCFLMLPVVLPVFKEMGSQGTWDFYWNNNIGRVTGSYMGTRPDPFYYLHNLSYLLLPWSIIFGFSVFYQFKKLIKKQFEMADHFLFWPTWIVFIILSFSQSKLPNYIQSLMPLLFIIMALGWEQLFKNQLKRWIKSQQIFLIILWCILLILLLIFLQGNWKYIVLLLGVGVVAFYWLSKQFQIEQRIFYRTLFLMVGIGFFLNALILPKLFNIQAQKQAAIFLSENEIQENQKLYNYNILNNKRRHQSLAKLPEERTTSFDKTPEIEHFHLNYELMFYTSLYVENIENSRQMQQIFKMNNFWIFTDENGKDEILNSTQNIDTLCAFKHFDIRRPARSVNFKTMSLHYENMYLIHILNNKNE